jgi:hypothetical protein
MEQAPWLAVFRSRRMAVLFLLTKANVPLDEIAAFSLVGLAYTFKFAWAPLLALVAAIVAMGQLSLYPGKKHMKCAKICGDTSGNYHPHGEAVIYPTLVHMAQAWVMSQNLVDG